MTGVQTCALPIYSLRFNGSYYISDKVGLDGTPLLSECGLPLNDTLEVRLNDCVKAWVDLKNVSVVNNDSIIVLWSTRTENFSEGFFERYDIYRSLSPTGVYDSIASFGNINDSIFYDTDVDVMSNKYNYFIKLILTPTLYLFPISDSIQSILLKHLVLHELRPGIPSDILCATTQKTPKL